MHANSIGGEARSVPRRATQVTGKSFLIAAMLLSSSTPALAQMGGQYPTNMPYGSPMDPYGQAAQQEMLNQRQSATSSAAQQAAASAGQSVARVEPVEIGTSSSEQRTLNSALTESLLRDRNTAAEKMRPPAPPNEFERFVERSLGRALPRFGANLLIPGSRDFALPATATVPPSYLLNPGDRVTVSLAGSITGTTDLEIDNDGLVFLPRVGSIRLAGISFRNLRSTIEQAVGRQFRDFRVSATVSQLRGIRVYVTGFANNPGAYTVSGLSTMVNAILGAGGPSAGGSFRQVELYRDGRLVRTLDLYELLRNGDRTRDAVLQNEDVLRIAPLGAQIAVTGSVNEEAIYEIKPGESVEDALRLAGGPGVLADSTRAIVYQQSDLDAASGQQVARADLSRMPAQGGHIIQILSSGTLARPQERQVVLVRIEGEVNRPGNYYVAANSTLDQVMALAGGTTSRAFIYGTNFQRQTVRQQQRQAFEEALQQFEISLAAAPLTADTSVDAGSRNSQLEAARAVIERLRQAQPDGRVVINLPVSATALPGTLTLENSDRIFIPPRPTTIGVFGAVYRPASFLIEGTSPRRVRDYVERAGGPIRAADQGQLFVVRASGEVISKRRGAMNALVYPGDAIFMPVKMQSQSVLARIIQFSTLFFQLGLSAATIVAVSK